MTATASKRILICDDDADILDLIKTLLCNAGYSVTTATGYEEFFANYKASKPDLILMDIRMPEHDGFWMAEELLRLSNKAPIIFVSAHNRSVYRLCAPIAGAIDFIIKPFDPDHLLGRVRNALKVNPASSNWFLYTSSYKPAVQETTE